MITMKIVLLLLGITTIVSSHVLRNGIPCDDEQLFENMRARIPPFGLPFMQQGTNLFYKPQFLTPGTVIPSPVVPFQPQPEKPHFPEPPVIVAPAPIEEAENKPMVLPEPPELPPFNMPEPSEGMFKEHDKEHTAGEPIIVEDFELHNPIEIPQPPQLPPLPEIPSPITIQIKPETVPEIRAPEFNTIFIPEAPFLPPYSEPNMSPVEIERPKPSVLPSYTISEWPIMPMIPQLVPTKTFELPTPPILPTVSLVSPKCDDSSEPHIVNQMAIPEAPVLPPLLFPELPIVPVIPEEPEKIEPASMKPIELPEPPILPPLTIPEMQVIPIVPEEPEYIEPAPEKPIELPEPPILPPFSMPELPIIPVSPVEIQPAPESPVYVPEPPVLPTFNLEPSKCDDTSDFSSDKPLEIPEPPILPPFSMPDLLVIPELPVEIQPVPEILIHLPEPPELPSDDTSHFSSDTPLEIPEAPVLQPFTITEIQVPINSDFSVPELEPEVPNSEPLQIPEAPVLPPFTDPTSPQIPIFEIPLAPHLTPISPAPEVIEYHALPNIPEAPLLPPFNDVPAMIIEEPVKPMQPIIVEEKSKEPCLELPEKNISLYGANLMQPTFWAQNIIIDRVLPNLIDNEKDIKILEGIKYPVMMSPNSIEYAQQ